MSEKPSLANIPFSPQEQTLANGSFIITDWLDLGIHDKYQLTWIGSIGGLTLETRSRASENHSTVSNTLTYEGTYFNGSFPVRQRFMQFVLTNNTGSAVTGVNFELKVTDGSSDKLNVTPLSVKATSSTTAAVVKSVLAAKTVNGAYENVQVNEIGAILNADFGTEISRDLYTSYNININSGRVTNVDIETTPTDILEDRIDDGTGVYTGFNATQNQELRVRSGSNEDKGSLITTGIATGGSNTSLIDTNATFIDDGVSVGDLVINDAKSMHGVITEVVNQTEVTVFKMVDETNSNISNASGNVYRIASSVDNGAAVIKVIDILDEEFVKQPDFYVILNGKTPVITSGVNAIRCSKSRIILAGSQSKNIGKLEVTQAVSTSNFFGVISNDQKLGSTTNSCFTVPSGKDCVIKRIMITITRNNGGAGSATVALYVRRFGEVFVAKPVYEVTTGGQMIDDIKGGIVLPPGTDIKGSVLKVSDNNTSAQMNIEYFLIDR